jgi:hypothetical protein
VPLIRLANVSLDCADPRALALFWAALLDGEIVLANERVCVVRTPTILLTTQRVDDHRPPDWPQGVVPKQVHVDLDVDDLAAAVEKAVGLGALQAEDQSNPTSFVVMLDPAGHPFCLTTQIPEPLRPRVT